MIAAPHRGFVEKAHANETTATLVILLKVSDRLAVAERNYMVGRKYKQCQTVTLSCFLMPNCRAEMMGSTLLELIKTALRNVHIFNVKSS